MSFTGRGFAGHNSFSNRNENLIFFSDVSQLFDLEHIPTVCLLLRKWLCPCLFSPFQKNVFNKKKSKKWINLFNQKLDDLVASGIYNDKEDFNVVIQPSLMRGELPIKNGIPDLDYLGPDCFHFAQRTHALGKTSLSRLYKSTFVVP